MCVRSPLILICRSNLARLAHLCVPIAVLDEDKPRTESSQHGGYSELNQVAGDH